MNQRMNPSDATQNGATVVITHRVREGKQADYETWLNEIGPLCRASLGHLDWQIIRPISGLTGTYTVIIRFDTREHLRQWMESPVRKRLIEKVQPCLARDDDFFIRSGLDFWFAPDGAAAKVPTRWKQFLVTWSAIYPLVLVVPLVVIPVMRQIGIPENRFSTSLFITGTVVFLMAYVVMPQYTKSLRKWLFN